MRSALWVALIGISLVGCKKKAAKPSGDKPEPGQVDAGKPAVAKAIDAGAAAAAIDAAAAAAPEADEAALRKDKKTGLGAADEKPEVLTEDLIVAIAEGKVDAERFVDPKRGFLDHTVMPGADDPSVPDVKTRACGADANKALAATAQSLVRRAAEGKAHDDDHALICSNEFVATADPTFGGTYDDTTAALTGGHAFPYAVCSSGGAGEYDANFELVFTPDAERGLRVVGLLTWESGMANVPWPDFATEAVKPDGCAP